MIPKLLFEMSLLPRSERTGAEVGLLAFLALIAASLNSSVIVISSSSCIQAAKGTTFRAAV